MPEKERIKNQLFALIYCRVLFVLFCTLLMPAWAFGDIAVVRELVVTPKTSSAAANIGSVNSSPNVRLDNAMVDIQVGKPQDTGSADEIRKSLPLSVRASFSLVNEADKQLKLTVGFPVSNSEYSSYSLTSFKVSADGSPREVFHRISGYPRRMVQEYVSGILGSDSARPPSDIDSDDPPIFGQQLMGEDSFQNLMVWEETFSRQQQKKVLVTYEILIPLQKKKITREKAQGNYKGIWPQEANNVPLDFINGLPAGSYYFFDYYLTSGASWAGPIGFEDVTLNFDQWWADVEFYTTISESSIVWSDKTQHPGEPLVAYYAIEDIEPTENIYFAIRPTDTLHQAPYKDKCID